MREFTLIEFKTNEAIHTYNYPIAIETGTLLSEVSEDSNRRESAYFSNGITIPASYYSTPAVKAVREIEVEYTF